MTADDGNATLEPRGFSREGLPKTIPPFWFLVSIVIQVLLHRLVPGRELFGLPWDLAGIPVVLAGIMTAVTASRQFTAAGTPIRPFDEMTTVVTEGVFAYTRNPMYLGMATSLTGIALLLGSLTPLFVPPLFVLFITFVFIRQEERVMEESFGEVYTDYKKRVRRWI